METPTEPVSPLPADPSSAFLELESLIKNYLNQIETLRKDLKKQKEMVEDSFTNDAVYQEQDEKAKEAGRIRSSTKQQILKQPALTEVEERIDEIKTQIKEAEEILSDYLLQYQKSTGFNEIETDGGETLIIVSRARLVKGSGQHRPEK